MYGKCLFLRVYLAVQGANMRKFLAVFLAISAFSLIGAPIGALAQETSSNGLVDSITPAEIAELLAGAKLQTKITTGSSGEPVVMAQQGDLKFLVRGVECSKGADVRCTKIQFRAGFKLDEHPSSTWMNDFNKTWVFGKAYVTADGVARVEYPINLEEGISEGNLINNFVMWISVLQAFYDHLSSGEIAPLT